MLLFLSFNFSEQIWSYLYDKIIWGSQIPIIVSTYQQAQVCACVSVCVFASTHFISSGQVSVCLPVSLLWGECLPKECTTSDLSLTLIVQLIQLVPWGWVLLCLCKWKIHSFLPLFDQCICTSPDLHQEKWEMKLLNIRINVTCQKQVLIKVRHRLLLLRLHVGLLLDLR